jgi:hypothetical protein
VCLQSIPDTFQYRIRAQQDVVVPETQHGEALAAQPGIAGLVVW